MEKVLGLVGEAGWCVVLIYIKKPLAIARGTNFAYPSIVKILNMVEVMITSSQNSLSSVVVEANASNGTPIISATTRESPGSSSLEGVAVATVIPKYLRIN